MEKTKITFKETGIDTKIDIMRNGKKIGHIWSQLDDGMTPYPHKEDGSCLNSIQLCGFDTMSEVWGCGVFKGKKDTVINFLPEFKDNDYIKTKMSEYDEYVRRFFEIHVKLGTTGKDNFQYATMNTIRSLTELKSFNDFVLHDGHD